VYAAIVTQLVTQLVSQSALRPEGHRPVQGVISQEAVLAAPLFGVVTFACDTCLPVLVDGHCVRTDECSAKAWVSPMKRQLGEFED
jgi:hypothetical protein